MLYYIRIMKPNSTSLKEVIGKVKRHKLLATLPEDTIVDDTIEFLRIMGLEETFEDKIAIIDIENYRGLLPEDFYEMIQVRTYNENKDIPPIYFRTTLDTFYKSSRLWDKVAYTYKIQGRVIFCSPLKEGKLEVAYKALELDECGLPLIPDDAKFIRAIVAYIKMVHFTDLFDEGQITLQSLQNAQQEYTWAAAACSTSMKMPSLDDMEAISNMFNSHIRPVFSHHNAYSTAGNKELYFTH